MPGGGAALRRALLGAGRRGAGGGSRAAMVSREGKRGLRCAAGQEAGDGDGDGAGGAAASRVRDLIGNGGIALRDVDAPAP